MSHPLFAFDNVTIARDDRIALQNVTLAVEEGEHVAILGPNGSGKSTLIKTITREVYPRYPECSSVAVKGEKIWNLFDLRSLMGIVTNDLLAACQREFKGLEIVLSGFFSGVGLWPHMKVTPAMERKAREVMERLELTHLANRWTDELSSGEARRILIARALVHDPQALVLDEPTASLDIHASHALSKILRMLAQEGTSVIMVTHHLSDIIPEIKRVILIRDGRIFCDGPKGEVLRGDLLSELFRTPVEVLRKDGYFHLW